MAGATFGDEPVGKRAHLAGSKMAAVHEDIWAAAVQGRVEDLLTYRNLGADLHEILSDRTDSVGNTVLHISAGCGHLDAMQLFMEFVPDVNCLNNLMQTPLMLAAEHGHTSFVKFLLAQHAEIESKDSSGATALLLASRSGCEGAVDELLAHGAEVDTTDMQLDTPLVVAATGAWDQLVARFVAAKAKIDHRNIVGETALIRAAMHSDAKTVKLLLEGGSSVDLAENEMGFNALLYASSLGRENVVMELLRAGANVGYTNQSGISALLLASRSGFLPVVMLLIEAGANVDHADTKGFTALMVSAIGGFAKVVEYLIHQKSNINQRNYEGVTALSAAAELGQQEVVDLLLQAGADPEGGVMPSGLIMSNDIDSSSASLPGAIPDVQLTIGRMAVTKPKTDSVQLAAMHAAQQQQHRELEQRRWRGDQYDDTASVSTNYLEPGTIVRSPYAKCVTFHIPHPDNPQDFCFYEPSEDNFYAYDDGGEHRKEGCCVIS